MGDLDSFVVICQRTGLDITKNILFMSLVGESPMFLKVRVMQHLLKSIEGN